jgi:hypothetical protein
MSKIKTTKATTASTTNTVASILKTKRFVVRKSLVGTNQLIEVTFNNGNCVTYNHDKVWEIMGKKLENMACFIKYKNYTCTNNIPVILRGKKLV